MTTTQTLLDHCLFFTSTALARTLSRLAEQVFAPTGLSPSHAFLLMLVIENPGITPSDLAGRLHLAQSTVTRFVDQLVRKGLVERKASGRSALISPTRAGCDLSPVLSRVWRELYARYSATLGEDRGVSLTKAVRQACRDLDES